MNLKEIKVKNQNFNYSVLIGNNILHLLSKKIKALCPKANKIIIIIDKKIPRLYKSKIKKALKNYELVALEFTSNEKLKSFSKINLLAEKCLANNINRSDIIISFGGGIIGDFSAFAASIIKRGINFINVPTTLLAQVDSSIGGKTGVNSRFGKNLIGSFYQPKLVLSDVSLLKSLPKREIICGYAEILKHAIIKDKKFFDWLKINTYKIIEKRNLNVLKNAIFASCKIKLHFVNQDVNEKNLRMILNFGHTFAHAIEAKNEYSKKINHGEAVLAGMIIATKLSLYKKTITNEVYLKIMNIYKQNKIPFSLTKFNNKKYLNEIINFMKVDKKNNDKKINLILLKKIGKTTIPGKYKMSAEELKKIVPKII
jgi:3-dehydroquinate synthase/shikimate kinase/3-dehydroquinate synthase